MELVLNGFLSEVPNAEGGGIHIATTNTSMTTKKEQIVRRFQRCYFVYILSSLSGMLYVGLTDDLRKRMNQHKSGLVAGFTKKYRIDRLMYFETYTDSAFAEFRELQIKKYRREKKIALFAGDNPQWKDLTLEIFQTIGIPRCARDFRRKPGFEAGQQSL